MVVYSGKVETKRIKKLSSLYICAAIDNDSIQLFDAQHSPLQRCVPHGRLFNA